MRWGRIIWLSLPLTPGLYIQMREAAEGNLCSASARPGPIQTVCCHGHMTEAGFEYITRCPWQFLLSKVIHWLIPIYIFFSWKIDTRYNLNFFFPMKYCSLECFRVLGELWKRCEGPILALNSCFYFLITRPKHINSLSFYFRLEKYFPPQELLFCASFSHP